MEPIPKLSVEEHDHVRRTMKLQKHPIKYK